jgi:hypothetical protein
MTIFSLVKTRFPFKIKKSKKSKYLSKFATFVLRQDQTPKLKAVPSIDDRTLELLYFGNSYGAAGVENTASLANIMKVPSQQGFILQKHKFGYKIPRVTTAGHQLGSSLFNNLKNGSLGMIKYINEND